MGEGIVTIRDVRIVVATVLTPKAHKTLPDVRAFLDSLELPPPPPPSKLLM